jgi:hypothetical protein
MLPSSQASVPSRTPSPHWVMSKRTSKVEAADGAGGTDSTTT